MEQAIAAPKLYTPVQVRFGSFLGGPIAAVYFLRQNFRVLEKPYEAQKTLLWGVAFVVGLMSLLPFLRHFPNYVIPLAYSFGAGSVAERWQLQKQAILDSGKYQIQSNWLVVGWSLSLLLAFVVIFAVEYFGLIALGWVDA